MYHRFIARSHLAIRWQRARGLCRAAARQQRRVRDGARYCGSRRDIQYTVHGRQRTTAVRAAQRVTQSIVIVVEWLAVRPAKYRVHARLKQLLKRRRHLVDRRLVGHLEVRRAHLTQRGKNGWRHSGGCGGGSGGGDIDSPGVRP